MEQALIDIRDRAIAVNKKHGELNPYMISCKTLIAILDELDERDQNHAALIAAAWFIVNNKKNFVPHNDIGNVASDAIEALAALLPEKETK